MSPGELIGGRYRLDRQLGEGGMGVVWAATHTVTQRALALKFIHVRADDPSSRARALREARAACAVQHPSVVLVHDVLEGDDGTPVLVMDLLRGESLAGRLEREKTIPAFDAVKIAKEILGALEAAHAVGIVHRDLKPDNVFLLEDGTLKILDFGVAKLRGKEGPTKETNRLTETGAMVGTPHYMAPEQAFGEGEVDARADLWSLGALLYECLSGVPPTNGQNLGQILKALATGSITPLRERVPEVSASLAAIVDGLLAIDREARPASAAVVLAALDALDAATLSHEKLPPAAPSEIGPRPSVTPPATTRASDAMEPKPRPRSRRVLVALGSLAAAAALAAGVIVAVRFKPSPRAEVQTVVAAPEPPPPATTAVPAASTPLASAPPVASSAPVAIASSPTAPRLRMKGIPKAGAGTPAASNAASPLLEKPPY